MTNADKQKIKETLEKQLQLLSERSWVCAEERDLAALTSEMITLASLLLTSF